MAAHSNDATGRGGVPKGESGRQDDGSRLSFNLCNLPPWVLASRHFQGNPQPVSIQGVREANRFLFAKLDGIGSAEERGLVFNDYMSVKFQLHQEGNSEVARKSLKNSYLRFLRGWMMDSNSVEGAVLKGWVESRMGLHPTFHKVPIPSAHSENYFTFVVDRTNGSRRTNAIASQLDILYEFCQYEFARRFPGVTAVELFRGTFDASDHLLLEKVGKRQQIVRLNNLSSFTSEEERAWEFGFTVWKVQVPVSKIFYFDELLPTSLLKGEKEYLVIGGDYAVTIVPCTV